MKHFFSKYHMLIKNCSWLYLIQVANYIFPLLVIPYLLRIVGVEKYGLVAMTQAIMMYINVIVDYGFNLTAVRELSSCKEDHEKCSTIFNHVMVAKAYLMLGCLFFYAIALYYFPLERELMIFMLVSFAFVTGSGFFPVWFFQGMEDMRYITFANLLSRLLYLLLLIIVIKQPEDYIWIIFLQGVGGILSSSFALYIIYHKYHIYLYRLPGWREMKKIFHEGWPIFIANACGNVYSKGAILITGMIAGQSAAAYYSLGQKISGTIANLVQPFVQAMYPYICNLYLEEKKSFYEFFYKLFKIAIILNVLLAMAMFALAQYIAFFLQGAVDDTLVYVIRIFIIVTFATLLNVLLHPFMLAMKMYQFIQKIYVRVSVLFIAISFVLVHYFAVYGMVVSLMVVEYFILSHYVWIIFKERSTLMKKL